MKLAYFVFPSRNEEARGLLELARRTRVDALPGGVYALREEDLPVADALELDYRWATDPDALLR